MEAHAGGDETAACVMLPASLAADLAEFAAGLLPLASLAPRLEQHRAALASALARAGVRPASAADALPPLPFEVVADILARLPVDQRLLAALVSRAWRRAAAENGVWRVVDLSPASGVRVVTEALLRAVAAKAAVSIVELDVSEQTDAGGYSLSYQAIHNAIAANGRTLRRLNTHSKAGLLSTADVDILLRSAPFLTHFKMDVACTTAEAAAVLRNEAPYGPLRVRALMVEAPWAGEASVLSLARDAAAHPSLRRIALVDAPLQTAPALAAVVDAAVGHSLSWVAFYRCGLHPGSLPQLTRLLRCGHLEKFEVVNGGRQLLGGEDGGGDDGTVGGVEDETASFCAALRACPLTVLHLDGVDLWDSLAVGDAVVAALVAHPTLQEVYLVGNDVFEGDEPRVGASYARLLVADSPALVKLSVGNCLLGDAGLRPILVALRGCTHLRSFHCSRNGLTPVFARSELLPAVAANTSLRELKADGIPGNAVFPPIPDLARAEALVAARPRVG